MENIYLDNAATTPVDPKVTEAMIPYLKDKFGNASSIHSFGREAKVLLEDARDVIAEFIGARSSEIYFTSGGTEANNFAIKGLAFNRIKQSSGIARGQIITSKIEHSAVLDTIDYLKESFGFSIVYLDNNNHGIVNIDSLNNLITDDTFLICVMHANNEIGIVNNIAGLSEIAQKKNIHLHTDTVQSLGKIPYKIIDLNCNTASFSAHKIYGPKGIGALYIRRDTQIDKLIHGGKQERNRRGGTENIAAIAGFKKAVELLKDEMDSDILNYKKLKDKLVIDLEKEFGNKIIYNSLTKSNESVMGLNNILNISFDTAKIKTDPETLLIKLDLNGIAVSSGSACTSGSVQPSHVVKALGYDDKTAAASLRISFGRFNKENDVDELVQVLKDIIH